MASRGGGRGGRFRGPGGELRDLSSIPNQAPPIFPEIQVPLPSKDPQPGSVEYEWLENLKMLRTNFKKSAYYYAVKEPQEMLRIERFSDQYRPAESISRPRLDQIPLDPNLFPEEIIPARKVAKTTKSLAKLSSDSSKLDARDALKTLDQIEKSLTKQRQQPAGTTNVVEEDEELQENPEEDDEDDNDYVESYFDNGEDFVDGDDMSGGDDDGEATF